jgi:prepilin-type N-terminal cleavage/methylation domain-containing protein
MAPTHRRLRAESGFTLIELLVVLVIIGVLAALGIAAFLNQRSKAQDGQAKVYAVTASKAIAVWHTDHDTYAGADVVELTKIEPSLDKATNLAVTGVVDSFTVSADSNAGPAGGGTFSVEMLPSGQTRRDCTNPGAGSCLATVDAQGNRW